MVMPGLHEGHIHDVERSDQKTCDLKADPLSVPELQARIQACLDDPALGDGDDWLVVANLYMQFLKPSGTAAAQVDPRRAPDTTARSPSRPP